MKFKLPEERKDVLIDNLNRGDMFICDMDSEDLYMITENKSYVRLNDGRLFCIGSDGNLPVIQVREKEPIKLEIV